MRSPLGFNFTIYGDIMDEDEYVYDEINGGKGKKRVLDALNKSKLGKHEMDELFCEWG